MLADEQLVRYQAERSILLRGDAVQAAVQFFSGQPNTTRNSTKSLATHPSPPESQMQTSEIVAPLASPSAADNYQTTHNKQSSTAGPTYKHPTFRTISARPLVHQSMLFAVTLLVALATANLGLVHSGPTELNLRPENTAFAASADRQDLPGLGSSMVLNATGTINPNQKYLLKIISNDPKSNGALISLQPLDYTNIHEPRIELRYQSKYPYASIDERAPNNTVVAAVVVNDEDTGLNGETSLSIEHGNELNHFRLVSTPFTNTIQVNGAPLSRHRVPEYNLTIMARDHGTPSKSSTSNLVIKLNAASPPMGSFAPQEPLGLKPPVTDLMYVGAMLVVIFSALIFLIIIGCALVQRPKSKKGLPPSRTMSSTNSRMLPPEHCFCPSHPNY